MSTKRYSKAATVTYTQASTTWTQMSALKRLTGLDQVGIQVQGASSGWNGSTVQAILQGCIVDDTGSTSPTESSGWQDIETLEFTASAFKRFGGSDYLAGLLGFQWYRVKGAVSAGTPSANVTLSVLIDTDYNDE